MNPSTSRPAESTGVDRPEVEQLSLLPRGLVDPQVPVQFRLDRRTRERGLAQVAALRQQLQQRRLLGRPDHRAA